MSELVVAGLNKAFGPVPVLRGVDVTVADGTLTAILGPSGCGKTTLLRLVAGFDRPDAGTIELDGRTLCGPGRFVAPERRRIGYVAQEGALFPHLSVGANILFGLPRGQRRGGASLGRLLELVGLEMSYARRSPHQLSGGQQQRVALARALAPGPEVILLDEPFSSLDTGLRAATRAAVMAALQAAGTTAILVTHDQAEALSLATQVGVMRDGRLAQIAAPADLYARPADRDTAMLVGAGALVPATATRGIATGPLGALTVDAGVAGPVELLVRPEQLLLGPVVDGRPVGVVTGSSFSGADSTITLLLEDGTEVLARTPGHSSPRAGDRVAVTVRGATPAYPDHTSSHASGRAEADARSGEPAPTGT
jgi:iron(III) transport system ATP-binding protein